MVMARSGCRRDLLDIQCHPMRRAALARHDAIPWAKKAERHVAIGQDHGPALVQEYDDVPPLLERACGPLLEMPVIRLTLPRIRLARTDLHEQAERRRIDGGHHLALVRLPFRAEPILRHPETVERAAMLRTRLVD